MICRLVANQNFIAELSIEKYRCTLIFSTAKGLHLFILIFQ